MTPAPRFDRVAAIYAPMERVTFGGALAACRNAFLEDVTRSRSALVLGDGDGRFTARLVAAAPDVAITAVDASERMLDLLEKNARKLAPNARIERLHGDARTVALRGPYDLVATHFFLDCLTTSEVAALVTRVTPTLADHATWIISDFAVPSGARGFFAAILVRALYLAFRVLTGLRITQLPEHDRALAEAGFTLKDTRPRLFGLLYAERWERDVATTSSP